VEREGRGRGEGGESWLNGNPAVSLTPSQQFGNICRADTRYTSPVCQQLQTGYTNHHSQQHSPLPHNTTTRARDTCEQISCLSAAPERVHHHHSQQHSSPPHYTISPVCQQLQTGHTNHHSQQHSSPPHYTTSPVCQQLQTGHTNHHSQKHSPSNYTPEPSSTLTTTASSQQHSLPPHLPVKLLLR